MPKLDQEHADVRVVESFINRGIITLEQYEAHLESLEDCAELAEETETRMTQSETTEED